MFSIFSNSEKKKERVLSELKTIGDCQKEIDLLNNYIRVNNLDKSLLILDGELVVLEEVKFIQETGYFGIIFYLVSEKRRNFFGFKHTPYTYKNDIEEVKNKIITSKNAFRNIKNGLDTLGYKIIKKRTKKTKNGEQ